MLSRCSQRSAARIDAPRWNVVWLVAESLVQLQFQDRVGQIMAQVVGSMRDLEQRAGGPAAANIVVKEYLAQMARTYTTEEQRRNHQGESAAPVAAQAVEFF